MFLPLVSRTRCGEREQNPSSSTPSAHFLLSPFFQSAQRRPCFFTRSLHFPLEAPFPSCSWQLNLNPYIKIIQAGRMCNPHRTWIYPQQTILTLCKNKTKKSQIPTKLKITPNYGTSICSYNYYSVALISEKAMAPHSSTLAWKIPWTEEPGRLQSMGSQRVGQTEWLHFHFSLSCTGERNGNPLQCSCLENPRDGRA